MAGDRVVQISYDIIVRGQQRLDELTRQNEQLMAQTNEYKQRLDSLNEKQERHNSVLLKAREAARALHRELYIFGFVAGTLAATMAVLAKGSNDLASSMENLGRQAAQSTKPLGDWLAKFINFLGGKGFTAPDLSVSNQVRLASMFSDIETLRGNTHAALIEKLRAEEIQLSNQVGDKWNSTFKRVFDERKRLLLENQALEELGLKRLEAIRADFRRGVVSSLQGGTSDTIFNFLQGEKQTPGEIVRTFTSGINRAVSEAISQTLFTTLAGGGGNFFENLMNTLTGKKKADPQLTQANERLDRMVQTNQRIVETNARIADCVCITAEYLTSGAGRATSATIELPKKSGLDKAAALLGGIGQIASLAAGFPTGGSGGGVPQLPPDIIMDPMPRGHSGGEVGRFASGGEIPIMAQPGEFIVRGSAAQNNKKLLKGINNGENAMPGGGGHVFLINAVDAKSFADMLSSPSARAEMELQMVRMISSNGQVRNVIKTFAR